MTKNEVISNTVEGLIEQRSRIIRDIEDVNLNDRMGVSKLGAIELQIQNIDMQISNLIMNMEATKLEPLIITEEIKKKK